MKKLSRLALTFVIGISLLGCSNEKDEVPAVTAEKPGIEGYVVKTEKNKILVVSSESKDYSSTGGVKEFYDAIWFSNVSQDVEIGQKVQVWFKTIEESYPGKSQANKILILPSKKPEGANLSDTEVIKQFLTAKSDNVKGFFAPIIKAVVYNPQSDNWNIHLQDADGKSELKFQVDDN